MSSGKATRASREADASSAGRKTTPTDPFFFAGNEVGCLLVHGFTGTPYEMRALGERLHAHGYSVCGVRLAGHTTCPEDLAACSWLDWYRSVETGLEALRPQCSTIFAVGLSLGSLLALRLAHERPALVAAVVVLAPALQLSNPWPARLAPLLRLLSPWLPDSLAYVGKQGSDIADPAARRIHPSYDRMPLRGISEVLDLQAEVRTLLAGVKQPTLAIHARGDQTVSMEGLALLQRELPNLRGTVVLPRSRHVVTVDLEKQRVAEEILRFAAQVLEERASARRRRGSDLPKGADARGA